jgi:hypothetical protein
MEVKLDKRYPLQVSPAQAWAVLSDIHATARCMPGAQITETIDDTHYKGTVKSRIGPASMQFGGDIEVLALDPATMSMQMLGKGADRGGSSASMNLSSKIEAGETPGTSVLAGEATIVVSGKLAQFGSRLLVPVSDAMLTQFADNFRAAAAQIQTADAGVDAGVDDGAPLSAHAAQVRESAAGSVEPPALTAVQPPPVAGAAPGSPSSAAPQAPTAPAASPRPAPLPAAPIKELNALALMWTVFKGWLAGLFGKRP